MSMASDLFEAIGRGHHNSLTMWAKKHHVPLQAGGSWPDRVKMATSFINPKNTKEANMAIKKTVPNTKPKKVVEEEVEEEEEQATTKKKKSEKPVTLGSKEVADMLGIPATSLRRYLRAHGHNTQGEYARYEWDPDGAALQKLLKEYKAYAASAEANKGENLKKGRDAKKAGKGKTKPVNEDVEEEEEEEIDEME